jgi:hypothetical protein
MGPDSRQGGKICALCSTGSSCEQGAPAEGTLFLHDAICGPDLTVMKAILQVFSRYCNNLDDPVLKKINTLIFLNSMGTFWPQYGLIRKKQIN